MTPSPQRPDAGSPLAPVVRERTHTRTSDRVYEELASAIRELRLLPGAALSETDLAEQLRVSRTPLREAIARLVENGLVSVQPQVGTRVERIRLSEVTQAQFIREHLETAAFGLAAKNPDKDLGRLRQLLAEQKLARKRRDVDAFFAADEAFHEEIFALAGYSGVPRAIHQSTVQLHRVRRLGIPGPEVMAELIDEHAKMADALAAGDVRAGRALLAKHIRRVLADGPALREAHPDLFTD